MGNQEKKKGNGVGSLIVSLILSIFYSFIVVHFIEVEQLDFFAAGSKAEVFAIILGIAGAFVTLLIVKAIMKRFVFFTRNPVGFYAGMYFFWPCIGVAIGQVVLLLLFGVALSGLSSLTGK